MLNVNPIFSENPQDRVEGISGNDILDMLGLDCSISDINLPSESDTTTWSELTIPQDVEEAMNTLDYRISIDRKNSLVVMWSNEGEIIGEIGKGTYERGKVSSNSHLYKKINPAFRGKGYGTALMAEYAKSGFLVPDFEFTRRLDVVGFMEKFGYDVFSIISRTNDERLVTGNPSIEYLNQQIRNGSTIGLIKSK